MTSPDVTLNMTVDLTWNQMPSASETNFDITFDIVTLKTIHSQCVVRSIVLTCIASGMQSLPAHSHYIGPALAAIV